MSITTNSHVKKNKNGVCFDFEGNKKWAVKEHFVIWLKIGLKRAVSCKVHIFGGGHKILRSLPFSFDCMYCSQK